MCSTREDYSDKGFDKVLCDEMFVELGLMVK